MHKKYDPDFEIPKNGKRVESKSVVIKHNVHKGMKADAHKCSFVSSGNGVITMTIHELGISISMIEDDIKKVLW